MSEDISSLRIEIAPTELSGRLVLKSDERGFPHLYANGVELPVAAMRFGGLSGDGISRAGDGKFITVSFEAYVRFGDE